MLILLTNIAFFHDLTCILSSQPGFQPNVPDHLALFSASLEESLRLFCESVRGKNTQSYPKNSFYLQCQYIQLLRYHCDILKKFIECKVANIDEFEYLALPKFSFEFLLKNMGTGDVFDNMLKNYKKTLDESYNNPAVFNQLAAQSEVIKVVDTFPSLDSFGIGLRFMNYHIPYGYEVLPPTTQLSVRDAFLHLLVRLLRTWERWYVDRITWVKEALLKRSHSWLARSSLLLTAMA